MHNSELCFDLINRELRAQIPAKREKNATDPMVDAAWVAKQFGTRSTLWLTVAV